VLDPAAAVSEEVAGVDLVRHEAPQAEGDEADRGARDGDCERPSSLPREELDEHRHDERRRQLGAEADADGGSRDGDLRAARAEDEADGRGREGRPCE
jgi:hypothetical protein